MILISFFPFLLPVSVKNHIKISCKTNLKKIRKIRTLLTILRNYCIYLGVVIESGFCFFEKSIF